MSRAEWSSHPITFNIDETVTIIPRDYHRDDQMKNNKKIADGKNPSAKRLALWVWTMVVSLPPRDPWWNAPALDLN